MARPLTNYGSGGAAQSGNFPGIAIPNPDAIQEFKIQTSQYDAEYGRNPGASVNVTTKDGTNSFHGAAWEFFRNSALDANDIFNRISEASLGQANKPETLNENMFGGTFGGPIKKDKLFFFGSYQGFRQLNAVGTNGFATGLSTGITPVPVHAPAQTEAAGTRSRYHPSVTTTLPGGGLQLRDLSPVSGLRVWRELPVFRLFPWALHVPVAARRVEHQPGSDKRSPIGWSQGRGEPGLLFSRRRSLAATDSHRHEYQRCRPLCRLARTRTNIWATSSTS